MVFERYRLLDKRWQLLISQYRTVPTVRTEPVEAAARTLARPSAQHAFVEGGSRDVAPAGESLSFASPKERNQRKGDPAVCDPFAALRGNLGSSVTGCTAELAARLRRSARTTAVSQFTKHARSDAHATPRPARPRRIQKGTRESDIHPGHRFARPHLAGASTTRCESWAERSDGPCGCSAVGCSVVHPCWLRLRRGGCGVARASERACFVL